MALANKIQEKPLYIEWLHLADGTVECGSCGVVVGNTVAHANLHRRLQNMEQALEELLENH